MPRWLPQLAVINPQQSIILLVLLKEHQSSHPGLDLMDLSGGFFLLGMIILPMPQWLYHLIKMALMNPSAYLSVRQVLPDINHLLSLS